MTSFGRAWVLGASLALATTTGAMAQAPANLGALVVQTCSGCHGGDLKGQGGMPLLRGRPAEELATKMNEFRANQRYSTVMGRLARGLTAEEIQAVSAYIASLR